MGSGSPPRVSVIMPAYNATGTLHEAVASALAQTLQNLEVIVIDDGSSEPVEEVLGINDARLRIARNERNLGVAGARNRAVSMARAPFLAQLDADDFWRDDHLEGALSAFEDEEVGLVYSNVEIIGSPLVDRAIAVRSPGDSYPEWLSDRALHPVNDLNRIYAVNPVPAAAALMRTSAVRAVGAYPTWLRIGEDYYLYIKLRRAGWRFAYVDRMSAVYRWPEPTRGVTFSSRLAARQNLKLFTVLMLQSPGEPAIRARVRAELAALVATHVPGALPVARKGKRLLRS